MQIETITFNKKSAYLKEKETLDVSRIFFSSQDTSWRICTMKLEATYDHKLRSNGSYRGPFFFRPENGLTENLPVCIPRSSWASFFSLRRHYEVVVTEMKFRTA